MLGLSSKMLRILQSLYFECSSAVWDGVELSNWFKTGSGVKQGCVLSPLLFALFLDDLSAFLPGGVSINGVQIKVLMYADDIVLLAETPRALQLMINRLNEYTERWKLKVNTEKSKIMVFQKHLRRRPKAETWNLAGERLEIVKEYKYLGVWITYNVNFGTHVKYKLKDAKLALNSAWKNVLGNDRVCISAKYKVFQAAVVSIMNYAAQIWGVDRYDDVEKLLRFFIKRIFKLPTNAPTYMIHLETGLSTLYVNTLKTHFNYVNCVLDMPNNRLPKLLALYLLERKALFFNTWLDLADDHDEALILQDQHSWPDWQHRILDKIDAADRERFTYAARTSFSRQTYSMLNYDLGERNYFDEKYSVESIRIIFKARGELLRLAYIPYESGAESLCSLCNLKETEDVKHFVAVCPILRELRVAYFGKPRLSATELENLLNGEDWLRLCGYISHALSYRQKIVEEAF